MKTHLAALSALRLGPWLIASAIVASAQPVLAPTSRSTPAAAVHDSGAPAGKSSKSMFEAAESSSLPLAKWGPVSVRPHVLYRVLHVDGLLNPVEDEDDSSVVQTVSPGILFEIGDTWTFDYTHSREYHSNPIFEDTGNHDASLTAAYRFERWSISSAQRYTNNSPTLIETAQQTPQENFVTDLMVVTRLGERTQLNSSAAFSVRRVNEIPIEARWNTADWRSWLVTESLEYDLSRQLAVGLGSSFGYDTVTPGPDMSHIRPHVRLNWRPTPKLALVAQGGLEQRKFEGGRGGRLQNPVYRAFLNYAPLPTTKLTLTGDRAFSASYFADWATRTAGWTAALEQRLLKRFYMTCTYSSHDTEFLFTSVGESLNREDRARTMDVRVTTQILHHGSISIFYQLGKNRSSEQGFTFTNHQAGTEIAYRF